MLHAVAKSLNRLEEFVVVFFMSLATIVIFLSILHRSLMSVDFLWDYLWFVHFSWAQEVCIYSFIWMAKFGAAYGVRTGVHIGVDILVANVSLRYQRRLVSLALIIGILFTAVISFLGVRWVVFIYSTGQVSPDLLLPMWIAYLCIPLGSGLMTIRFLQVFSVYLKSGFLPGRIAVDKQIS